MAAVIRYDMLADDLIPLARRAQLSLLLAVISIFYGFRCIREGEKGYEVDRPRGFQIREERKKLKKQVFYFYFQFYFFPWLPCILFC